jgi:hypothetical protein
MIVGHSQYLKRHKWDQAFERFELSGSNKLKLPLQSPLVYIFQSPEYVTSKSTENKELDYITICQIHVAE